MPTRRAFLMIGGAFAFGSVVGGACGYSLGAGKAGVAEAAGAKDGQSDVEVPESGDAQLNELRRLAVKAPIEEFVEKWNPWWGEFWSRYDRDSILWVGVDRLAAWATQHPTTVDFDMLSALVMACQNEWRGPNSVLLSHRKFIEATRTERRKKR